MNFSEYKKHIEKEILFLNQREMVSICLICCNRLVPLYSKFSIVEDWGDETVLDECRQVACYWLDGMVTDMQSLLQRLEDVTPDSEDFGSALGTYAQNASIAHGYLLDQINSDDHLPLIYVLDKCYETIDLHIQEILDPDFNNSVAESTIENHPLMIKEINWQFSIINKVKDNQDLVKLIDDEDMKDIFLHE